MTRHNMVVAMVREVATIKIIARAVITTEDIVRTRAITKIVIIAIGIMVTIAIERNRCLKSLIMCYNK